MAITRVLHLVGSPTSDAYFELSVLYARGCIEALHQPARYEFVIALVSPGGLWRFPESLDSLAMGAAKAIALSDALAVLANLQIDVALPHMFCLPGMTHYRSLLEIAGIAFIGNRPFQMALAADKAKTKSVVSAAGVRVPKGELLVTGQQPTLVPPVVVKPNAADNSEGVSLVQHLADYPAALRSAFACGDAVVVEEYIPLGREVRCAIVVQDGQLRPLPLEEYFVDAASRPVRLGADKLKRDSAGNLTLAAKQASEAWMVDTNDPITAAVWRAATACHIALGCRHYSLFDFRIDPHGAPWFLEAGLYCSFSPKSVVATMMAAAGIPLTDFFDHAVLQALNGPSGPAQLTQQAPGPTP